jgi:hypothetical protein
LQVLLGPAGWSAYLKHENQQKIILYEWLMTFSAVGGQFLLENMLFLEVVYKFEVNIGG